MDDGEREGPVYVQRRVHRGGEGEDQVGRRDDVACDGLRVLNPGEEPSRAGQPVEGEERGEGSERVQERSSEWCWSPSDPILLVEDSIADSESVSRGLPKIMLVRLRQGLASAELDPLLALCRDLGYGTRFLDEGRRLLELSGQGDRTHRTRLEDHPDVVEVVAPGDSYELHARGADRPDTVDEVGGVSFGGGGVGIAAGPCSVEDYERLLLLARGVLDCGVSILRGGAYKPRTSPYSFQGLGVVGL